MLICENCHTAHGCRLSHPFSTNTKEEIPLPVHDTCGICFQTKIVFPCERATKPILTIHVHNHPESLRLTLVSLNGKSTSTLIEGENLDKLIKTVNGVFEHRSNNPERGRRKMSLDVYLSYKNDGNEIEIFSSNITHNLGEMADKAGIYKACWRPEEVEARKAKDLIKLLKVGLGYLKSNPIYFKKFDDPDDWGTYNQFVPWVEEYLNACKKYPNAKIRVSR